MSGPIAEGEGRVRPALSASSSAEQLEAASADKSLHSWQRHMAVALLVERHGRSPMETARVLGFSRSSIYHARKVLKKTKGDDTVINKILSGQTTVYAEYKKILGKPPGGDPEKRRTRARELYAERRKQEREKRQPVKSNVLEGFDDRYAESQYKAMLSAPATTPANVPMLKRAAKVQENLGDLLGLDPEVAAGMMPASRCRQFSDTQDLAVWWLRFAAACEKRRAAETPMLGPLRRASRAKWLVEGGEPETERALSPGASAVLAWLRKHGPGTVAQAALATALRWPAQPLKELVDIGLVEELGSSEKTGRTIYRAIVQEVPGPSPEQASEG